MVKSAYSLILQAHQSTGIPWHVIERDYLLSWFLAGISQVPTLFDTLVFKGGTALRKCYFDDYRFSEDLDFTGLPEAPRGDNMENSIREACEIVQQRLLKEPVNIVCKRYNERRPHPGNQEAFKIRAASPGTIIRLPALWWKSPWMKKFSGPSKGEKSFINTTNRSKRKSIHIPLKKLSRKNCGQYCKTLTDLKAADGSDHVLAITMTSGIY